MPLTTRLYLSGVCVALVLCATAVTFPEVPPTVMLGILGGIFLALASRTHRHAQAQHGGDGRIDKLAASHPPQQVVTAPAIVYERRRDPAVTIP